jgi:hypothetical protein
VTLYALNSGTQTPFDGKPYPRIPAFTTKNSGTVRAVVVVYIVHLCVILLTVGMSDLCEYVEFLPRSNVEV